MFVTVADDGPGIAVADRPGLRVVCPLEEDCLRRRRQQWAGAAIVVPRLL